MPPSVIGASLQRVDPATLTPVESSETGPLGHWAEMVSANGDELALTTYHGHDAQFWSLWLVESSTGTVTELDGGGPYAAGPIGLVHDDDGVTWLEHRSGNDPNFPGGFSISQLDRLTGEVSMVFTLESRALWVGQVRRLGPDTLGVFATAIGDDAPRVMVIDLASGQSVLDVALDTDPPILGLEHPDEYGGVVPGWDLDGMRLFVPHLTEGTITTVDLVTGAIATASIIEQTSWLDRFLAAWVPTAQAKGPHSLATTAVSMDSSLVYLTGKKVAWAEDREEYREVPVGLTAVDADTLEVVARSDLETDQVAVSPDGRTLLVSGWSEGMSDAGVEFASAGVHLLEADTLEPLLSPEPGGTPYYQLAYSADGRYGYAFEQDYTPYNETPPRTLILDTNELVITEAPALDSFHPDLLSLGYILGE